MNAPTRSEYETRRDAIYMAYDAKRSALVSAAIKAHVPAHEIAKLAGDLRSAYRAQLDADPTLVAYHAANTRV